VVAILTGLTLLLMPTTRFVMVGMAATMICYVLLNVRYR
jgi:hypothetical protein